MIIQLNSLLLNQNGAFDAIVTRGNGVGKKSPSGCLMAGLSGHRSNTNTQPEISTPPMAHTTAGLDQALQRGHAAVVKVINIRNVPTKGAGVPSNGRRARYVWWC